MHSPLREEGLSIARPLQFQEGRSLEATDYAFRDYYQIASNSEFLSVECISLDVVQAADFLFADF